MNRAGRLKNFSRFQLAFCISLLVHGRSRVYTESVSEILQLPDDALMRKTRQVAQRVREAGGRALLVGGYVRDALLNLSPKDADVEVYGLEAEVLRKVLNRCGRVGCVGESFRVYKLSWHEQGERFELDVSLPRRDKKVGQGHRGFEVEGDPHASFEDAARRRDFTVNAILCDPLSGEIIDPFGGRQDLNNRVLKMVDAAHFAEDSLRVLRACQFAARFQMTVDEATAELCRQIDLSDLPRERIWGEWEKLLLKAEKPSIGLGVAYELKVLEKLFPELHWAIGRSGTSLCRSLDNAVVETQEVLDEKKLAVMFSVFGHYLKADKDNRQLVTQSLLDKLGIYTLNGYDVRKQVLALVNVIGLPDAFYQFRSTVPDGAFRRAALDCEPKLLWRLNRSVDNKFAADWFKHKMQELGVWNGPPAPLLLGRHLLEMGLKPGPRIGEITRAVYEKQLDGDVSILEEAKEYARKLIDESAA
jgi:tRNA nucleotidyltransferase (CCA-adding enzyme)